MALNIVKNWACVALSACALGCGAASDGTAVPTDATATATDVATTAEATEEATSPADPCPIAVASCPATERLVRRVMEDGLEHAVCVPSWPDCQPSQVPDAAGGCVEVAAPCVLGVLAPSGRCEPQAPKCTGGTSAVAGACMELAPRLDCPANGAPWPELQSDETPLYVSASGDASTADGSQAHPFKTITAALAKATSGTAILVGKGSYAPFVVSKSGVRVRGRCPAEVLVTAVLPGEVPIVIAGSPTTSVSNVRVSGFRVQAPKDFGVLLSRVTGSILERIDVLDAKGVGVQLQHAVDVTVSDVRVGTVVADTNPTGTIQFGVSLAIGVKSVTVRRALIDMPGLAAGVRVSGAADTTLEACEVTGAQNGVDLNNTTGQTTLRQSRIAASTDRAIQIGPPSATQPFGVQVDQCELRASSGVKFSGVVSFAPGLDLAIVASLIDGADSGVWIERARSVRVHQTRIDQAQASAIETHAAAVGERIEVTDSTIRYRKQGLLVEDGKGLSVLVSGNRIEGLPEPIVPKEAGSHFATIGIIDGDDVSITGNTLLGVAGQALVLTRPRKARLTGNVLVEAHATAVLVDGEGLPAHVTPEVRIERNHVQRGGRAGIESRLLTPHTVSGNLLRGIGTTAAPPLAPGAAITLSGPTDASGRAEITRNAVVEGAADGLYVTRMEALVTDNVIVGGHRSGLVLEQAKVTVERNTIALVRRGPNEGSDGVVTQLAHTFAAQAGTTGTVSDNRWLHGDDVGMLLSEAPYPVVARNHIEWHAGTGLVVQYGRQDAQLTENTIACAHGAGVALFDGSASLAKNTIRDTRLDALATFGVAVQLGKQSQLTMNGDRIERADDGGIATVASEEPNGKPGFIELTVAGVTMTGVSGIGIDLHRLTRASLTNVTLDGADGMGVAVRGAELAMIGGRIEGVRATGPKQRFGDGLHLVLGGHASLDAVTVNDCARAGIVLHGGTVTLTNTAVSGNRLGVAVQGAGVLSGDTSQVTDNRQGNVVTYAAGDEIDTDLKP